MILRGFALAIARIFFLVIHKCFFTCITEKAKSQNNVIRDALVIIDFFFNAVVTFGVLLLLLQRVSVAQFEGRHDFRGISNDVSPL
jgi:hypothetical protein